MRNGRAVLFYSVISIFVATATVTLLGVAEVLTIQTRYLNVLFSTLVLELVVAVVGLFKATNWFGPVPESIAEIAGDWWQVSRVERENAIAFIRIQYVADRLEIVLKGDAYSPDGSRVAEFWQIAGSVSPGRKMYYFWKGDHPDADDDYSGVGVIRFEEPEEGGRIIRGSGWYTTGNIEQGVVTERRKVEYYLATVDEARAMGPGGTQESRRAIVTSIMSRLRPKSPGA